MRDLRKQIQELVDGKLDAVWTCAVGVVIKSGTRSCDVQVKVKTPGPSGVQEFPVLEDVPILYPKAGKSFLVMPPKKNDVVLLIFSKFDVTGVFDDSNVKDEIDARRFDFNSAVVIPGFFLSSDALAVEEDEILLMHESGSFLKFYSNGNVELHAKKFDITQA